MIECSGDSLRVTAPMVIANARELLLRGQEALANVSRVDLAAVPDADSSALTVLFAWMRRTQAQGRSFSVVNPPASLLSLAALYGVADLLPLA
ncbi:MAG TPA: STAS domain-containing protein [Azospira sp.]|nr:STAS domain-containing protein [Azospira sp.]